MLNEVNACLRVSTDMCDPRDESILACSPQRVFWMMTNPWCKRAKEDRRQANFSKIPETTVARFSDIRCFEGNIHILRSAIHWPVIGGLCSRNALAKRLERPSLSYIGPKPAIRPH